MIKKFIFVLSIILIAGVYGAVCFGDGDDIKNINSDNIAGGVITEDIGMTDIGGIASYTGGAGAAVFTRLAVNAAFMSETVSTTQNIVTFNVIGVGGSISARVGGTQIVSGDPVDTGSNVIFTAAINSGYKIKAWTWNGTSVDGHSADVMTLNNITADTHVTVEFELSNNVTYKATFYVVGGNGSLTARVDGAEIASGANVASGKRVVFTAVPATGYRVKTWTIDGTASTSNTTNSYTSNSLNSDITVTIEYESTATTYTITFSVTGGNGSVSARVDGNIISSGAAVARGKNVTFTASPASGYRVKAWTRDGTTVSGNTTNSFMISSMTAATTVRVEFEPIATQTYIVTFSVSGSGGSITARVDGAQISSGASVARGKRVEFTASPGSGHTVKAWTRDGTTVTNNTSNSYSITNLTAAATVRVEFVSSAPAPTPTPTPTPATGSSAASVRSTTLEVQPFSGYYSNWASKVTNYLVQNADKSITSVNVGHDTISIETSDTNGKTISAKELKFGLPIFGAFFSGEKFNYIAYGQTNSDENNNLDVILIEKYDKQFNMLGSATISGRACGTRTPFSAGCARMAENGKNLILHMSRGRYISSDGLSHQSNFTAVVDTERMLVTHTSAMFPNYHVSHSFDQYVMFDGDAPVTLDHGDAYPRSILLQRSEPGCKFNEIQRGTMLSIPGATGDNYTGVSVGGLAMSGSNYITAIAAVDFSKDRGYPEQRDISALVMPKTLGGGTTANRILLGKYIGTDVVASTPRLISNGGGTFIVLWQEFSQGGLAGDFVARTINADGQPVGDSRRYSDVLAFYAEFFNVKALPSSVYKISGIGPAHEDDEDLGAPVQDGLSTASDWARSEILQALEMGFVPFDLRGDYTKVITREEFCRMAVKYVEIATGMSIDEVMALKGVSRKEGAFVDTNDPNILAAFALGITNGTGDGVFSPLGIFNREQAARMIMNVCMVLGMDINNAPNSGFSDMGVASDWAVQGINFCFANGIMIGTGENRFSPMQDYTREQSILTFIRIN